MCHFLVGYLPIAQSLSYPWRKSTEEDGMAAMDECAWQRSTKCDSNACIEVARNVAGVQLRDAMRPDGPRLAANRDQWRVFLGFVKNVDIRMT